MSPLLLPPNTLVSALVCFAGNGGVNETGDWRISNFSSASKVAKSCSGFAWNAGDGGVADARGDARGSDEIEALGVRAFGGGDGIIADGDCESGIALTHW